MMKKNEWRRPLALVQSSRPPAPRPKNLNCIVPFPVPVGGIYRKPPRNPGTLQNNKVGKHLTSLDGVPPGVSSRTTHLFLSNNSLHSLRGLEAFSAVACLSLSQNLLRRTEDLRPLASLPRLEALSLEGSPVCGAANYRAHVVSLAPPCLRTLDRREVRSVAVVGRVLLLPAMLGTSFCSFPLLAFSSPSACVPVCLSVCLSVSWLLAL